MERKPEFFSWTRMEDFLVQPLNGAQTKTAISTNPFIRKANFLGGKTGTSPEAKENSLALFSLHNKRVVLILLGSNDRIKDTETLLKWVEEAYQF